MDTRRLNWIARLTIKGRLMAAMVGLVVVALGAATIPTLIMATDTADESARKLSGELSHRYGVSVEAGLNDGMDVARTIRNTLLELREQGQADRTLANALLERTLANHPELLAVWTAFEPDAFDGKDSAYIDSKGHDETGRFVPYWYRSDDGIQVEPLIDYDKEGAGDYYQLAKNTAQEVILEPYMYEVGGKETLITSITAPILDNGRTIGVAGIDLAMTGLQKQLAEIAPYGTGFGTLVSNEGKIVTHPDNANINRHIADIGFDPAMAEAVREGDAYEAENDEAFDGGGAIRLATPVRIGETTTPWSFVVTIPKERAFASVTTLRRNVLAIAGVAVLLAILVAWLMGNGIGKPIRRMTDTMNRLAQGDNGVDVPGRNRNDETGQMANAVEVFKQNAIEAERLKKEQEAAEQRAEEEKRQAMHELADSFEAEVGEIVKTVSSTATELDSTAQQMNTVAASTTDQAGTVSAAATQASSNVQTVASAAEELSKSIGEIGTQVAQASEKAKAAVGEAESANTQISGLAEAADKIGEVVNLIQDIAEQTNLLALNATIEAARAGDAGKGFAVVAQEVKSLANQTAKATDDISTRIASVQAQTKDAVEAINKIVGSIREIDETASTVASAVEQQNAATAEISRNVQDAAQGTQNVTASIGSVSEAAQNTGSAATQVTAAVSELSQQSERLDKRIGDFLQKIRAA